MEENYRESDRIQDNKVEQLIIKLKPTDSSSSEMESFSESSDSSDSDQPQCESCFRFVYIFYQSEEITQIFSFSNKQLLMIISAYFCNMSHFTGLWNVLSHNFDRTVPAYWSLVRSPQFFTNCKIIFFYPRVTDQSLQKVLTTNNTLYSTKCFDYFANEISKFQTQ